MSGWAYVHTFDKSEEEWTNYYVYGHYPDLGCIVYAMSQVFEEPPGDILLVTMSNNTGDFSWGVSVEKVNGQWGFGHRWMDDESGDCGDIMFTRIEEAYNVPMDTFEWWVENYNRNKRNSFSRDLIGTKFKELLNQVCVDLAGISEEPKHISELKPKRGGKQ